MDEYTLVRKLGEGSFGSVFLQKRNKDDKLVACKAIKYKNKSTKEKQHIVNEVNILQDIRSTRVTRYYGSVIDKKNLTIFIMMEYCENDSLYMLVKRHRKNKTRIEEDCIWKYASQLCEAVLACHTQNILHRDIKPENVLLDSNNNVKLGDFGFALKLEDMTAKIDENVGSAMYMSPERASDVSYGFPSDIWSLGCVIYELAALRPVFEATNALSLFLKITEGRFPRIPSQFSDRLQLFVRSMLHVSEKRRPTAQELAQYFNTHINVK